MNTDLVIVIPARGGSVGIPRKNLHTVGGVALVTRAVATAVAANGTDIIVSTDDDEIATAARSVPCPPDRLRIRYRPVNLATDEASSEDAVIDALQHAARSYEFVIMMQATSPFTHPSDVKHVAEQLRKGAADSVVSVADFHGFLWGCEDPSLWIGAPIAHDVKQPRVRRQDFDGRYIENGALYGTRVADLRRTRNRFGDRVELYVMPKWRSLEIDDLWDLDVAQRMDGWPGPRSDR